MVLALGIDQSSGVTNEMLQKALKRARENCEVLLLYGHCPLRGAGTNAYNFDLNLLESIVKNAQKIT
jgi:hypothetical protein